MNTKPTPADLKFHHQSHHPESHFFDSKTMRFFGDSMSNYRVSGPVMVDTWSRGHVECWALERKRAVKNGLKTAAYFSTADFEQIQSKK